MSGDEALESKSFPALIGESANRFLSKLSDWSLTRIVVIGLISRLDMFGFLLNIFRS